ncbi:MAG TPA: helix-turn-helix transcriptional regulator [Stellaceae bacterium]
MPKDDFDRLIEARETIEDVAAFDAVTRKLASGEEELLPADMVKRIVAGENPIKVWRQYRGLTEKDIADTSSVAQAYISQIENGQRAGTVETLKKIAAALNVSLDDIAG